MITARKTFSDNLFANYRLTRKGDSTRIEVRFHRTNKADAWCVHVALDGARQPWPGGEPAWHDRHTREAALMAFLQWELAYDEEQAKHYPEETPPDTPTLEDHPAYAHSGFVSAGDY